MINLDAIIESGVNIKFKGKEITVKGLNITQAKAIDKLQSEMTEENAYEKREEITILLLNNNAEGVVYTKKDIHDMPIKLQVMLQNEVTKYMYNVANDPN